MYERVGMKKEILNVKDLSVQLGGSKVLEHISFSVHERDVLVILGPNGSGKTTLLRALVGLVPYSGSIVWKEKRISYLPPQELINKQYLLPLTVSEFLSLKRTPKHNIKEQLKLVELDPMVEHQCIATLSTGQFQRMLVAWALSSDPAVLVFDEPTTGIDIAGQENIYALLHRLWKDNGLTIIIVTHHVHVVWEHATNVLCINKKMLCHGTPELILTKENLEKIYGVGAKLYEHRHIV